MKHHIFVKEYMIIGYLFYDKVKVSFYSPK